MGLTMGERRALTEQVARRYRSAGTTAGRAVTTPLTLAATADVGPRRYAGSFPELSPP